MVISPAVTLSVMSHRIMAGSGLKSSDRRLVIPLSDSVPVGWNSFHIGRGTRLTILLFPQLQEACPPKLFECRKAK